MESFCQNAIKHKPGFLNLAAERCNIFKMSEILGLSRDAFYPYRAAREADGVEALFSVSRRKPHLKNSMEETTRQTVFGLASANETNRP